MNRDDRDSEPRLIAEVRDIWDAKAAFWDERMGEGNQFQLELIGPAVERLLAVRPEEQILDVGCGNGVTSRRLAHLGARVVAVDYSARFLELARSRSRDLSDRIEYRLVDATDEEQLLALGEDRFDALVCNMVLMDHAGHRPAVAGQQAAVGAGWSVRLRRAASRLQQQCRALLRRD